MSEIQGSLYDFDSNERIKLCRTCGKTKPISEFRRNHSGRPTYRCRACLVEYQREYNYGITSDTFRALRRDQEGKCGICGVEPDPEAAWPYNTLVVDHCHETGAIRGLLCHDCNMFIGQVRNDPARCRAAAAWLERPAQLVGFGYRATNHRRRKSAKASDDDTLL